MDIIIGAGATGLSYASFTDNDCLILEADSKIGGYCKTVRQDDFVWDYSGHFFHFRHPEMERYICEYIPAGTLLRCHKHTQIKYRDSYVDFPFQKNIHQLEKQEFIDCLYDLFCNPYTEYTNFQEMLYCKFGKSIAEKFLIPYNEKLYACPLNSLDAEAMGRFFPYANKEEIIANFKSPDCESYNEYFTYPRGGAVEYIQSLAYRIPDSKIHLEEEVTSVDVQRKTVTTVRGNEYGYDHLISTIPFPRLLSLCGMEYDSSVYSWNKVLVFNLGFDSKGNDSVNNWVYFPDKEQVFYRIGYYDNIFHTDRMSLYVEIGFDRQAEIDVERWFARVMSDLQRTGIVTGQRLVARHHVIMNPAYVRITGFSQTDVATRKACLASRDVYSIGRYGSWTYCSIEDGMTEARALGVTLSGKED